MTSNYIFGCMLVLFAACNPALEKRSEKIDDAPAITQSDITFIVAGKTGNYRQSPEGALSVLNFHFFAEIFLQASGKVDNSSIETPAVGGVSIPFADSGYALEMHGGRYSTKTELEAAYPNGNYLFNYTAPSIGVKQQTVRVGDPQSKSSPIPAPPTILLSQQGRPVAADRINPVFDLLVNWSAFSEGGADPLAIMDDLLFVIMGDCHGVRRAHSGRPFEGTAYLTYRDKSYVITADKLLPENVYQLSVEHAILDTSIEYAVPAFATYATTTFLDIHTLGEAEAGQACDVIRNNFDAGQVAL